MGIRLLRQITNIVPHQTFMFGADFVVWVIMGCKLCRRINKHAARKCGFIEPGIVSIKNRQQPFLCSATQTFGIAHYSVSKHLIAFAQYSQYQFIFGFEVVVECFFGYPRLPTN